MHREAIFLIVLLLLLFVASSVLMYLSGNCVSGFVGFRCK